jgi:hypothetical protein
LGKRRGVRTWTSHGKCQRRKTYEEAYLSYALASKLLGDAHRRAVQLAREVGAKRAAVLAVEQRPRLELRDEAVRKGLLLHRPLSAAWHGVVEGVGRWEHALHHCERSLSIRHGHRRILRRVNDLLSAVHCPLSAALRSMKDKSRILEPCN